jgi:hypothetical protein
MAEEDDKKLQSISDKIKELQKQEAVIKKRKAKKQREDQNKREAIIGKIIFDKAKKGSVEHQAMIASCIEALSSERDKKLFNEYSRKLNIDKDNNDDNADQDKSLENESFNKTELSIDDQEDNKESNTNLPLNTVTPPLN